MGSVGKQIIQTQKKQLVTSRSCLGHGWRPGREDNPAHSSKTELGETRLAKENPFSNRASKFQLHRFPSEGRSFERRNLTAISVKNMPVLQDAQLDDDDARIGKHGGGAWVGCGRVPCDDIKDSDDSAPRVPRLRPRLRAAPKKLTDFPIVFRSASSTETAQKPPPRNMDHDEASMGGELGEESAFHEPPESEFLAGGPRPADCVLRLSWLESCATGNGCLALDSVA